MNKKYLIGAVIIGVAAVLVFTIDWVDLGMKNEIKETTQRQNVQKEKAVEALKGLVNVANRYSNITSDAVSNFEIDDLDGRSANFGIMQSDGVRGVRIVEEHIVTFRETGTSKNNTAEVDRNTNRVIAMHRSVPDFATSGDPLPVDTLETIARQFVEKVYPEFLEVTLEFEPGNKSAPEKATNYFFRWNDKQFAVPDGLDMDIPPFVQVGITSNGFIFSYDNTIPLYHNLPKEALRKLCGFVEMPQSDDSSLDPEKGEVIIWFSEYEPFQNRYLVLPFEPETDFEGCSESAKNWLRGHPYLNDDWDKN